MLNLLKTKTIVFYVNYSFQPKTRAYFCKGVVDLKRLSLPATTCNVLPIVRYPADKFYPASVEIALHKVCMDGVIQRIKIYPRSGAGCSKPV